MSEQRNYHDPKYIAFRKAVKERDNGKCIICGSGKKIEVHHLLKWCENETLRYSINNGCCLCYRHHKKVTGFEEHYVEMLLRLIRLRQRKLSD